MLDDFSYVKSAQVLASTGRIAYNGWSAPILGWQLFLGALFLKLFGSSFTAARASTVVVALVTVFLTQRTYIRLGISPWNAMLGTLTLTVCPIFLPLTVSFMSDIGGLFCIVICFYACLRSVQAQIVLSTLAWLIFAAHSGAVLGTVRQISWLGVLVIFPCTVWLVRRRRHSVLVGAVLYIASVAFVLSSVAWFLHQPYSIPENLVGEGAELLGPQRILGNLFEIVTLGIFLLPILSAFTMSLCLSRRAMSKWFGLIAIAIGVAASIAIAGFVQAHYSNRMAQRVIVPFTGNPHSMYGFPLPGEHLHVPAIILAIPAATYASFSGFFLWFVLEFRHSQKLVENSCLKGIARPGSTSWSSLLTLIVPFVLSYCALLIPRAVFSGLYDRYLIPLMFFAIPICLRLFQERIHTVFPSVSWLLVLLFAAYTTSATHDTFGQYRARLAAIREMETAGIPATSIDGGFEFNGMTQIEATGHLNNPLIRVPKTAFQPTTPAAASNCPLTLGGYIPMVRPKFALSLDPNVCGGLSSFPPVPYRSWLGLRIVNIYIVKTSID
jgi:hypothetical protein